MKAIPVNLEIGDTKKSRVRYLCRILGTYYANKGFAVSREVGLPEFYTVNYGEKKGQQWHISKQRADFIAVSLRLNQVVIVETKSCLADFTSDKKWRRYLPHCDKFYFAADTKTAEEIAVRLANDGERDIGVFAIDLNPTPYAILQNISWISSASRRPRETPIEVLLWQMAARSSGFGYGGILRRGNVFEDYAAPTEAMRIK